MRTVNKKLYAKSFKNFLIYSKLIYYYYKNVLLEDEYYFPIANKIEFFANKFLLLFLYTDYILYII